MTRINDYLESRGLSKLINKRSFGIKIDPKVKEILQNDLSNSLEEMYLYTQKERNAIQTLILLCFNELINVSFFEALFALSRNTIVSDLKDVKKMLSVYNLALEYDSNCGYVIEGSALRKRSVILNIISKYEYLLKIKSYNLFSEKDVKFVYDKFTDLENILNIQYVNDTLVYLSMLISIVKRNQIEKVTFTDIDEMMLKDSKEYKAVVQVFKDFIDDDEILYVTLHLLGLRVQTPTELENFEDDYINEIVDFMIEEFSKLTLIYFDNQDELFKNLYLHMRQAMFRLKYGIIFENEVKDSIFENYPQITYVTNQICNKLESKLGYPIGDDDVAYIAMHFGGHLNREKRDLPKYKVLLVCLNGIATSKLLKKELEYLLGNIEIIDVVRLDEIERYQDEVDYIISTVPIKNPALIHKSLQVNSVLNEVDKAQIISLFGAFNPNYGENEMSKMIIDDIKEYLPKDKIEEVRRKILYRISKINVVKEEHGRKKNIMLKELIREDRIIFKDKVSSWQEALWVSAKPLLDAGDIEKRYIDKVISNVHELGPYIVIAPNIAISHARPENGVKNLSMSILILKEAVNFSETSDRNSKIIITLAAPDGEKHLLALQQLSSLLMDSIDELFASENVEQVLKLIKEYSEKEI